MPQMHWYSKTEKSRFFSLPLDTSQFQNDKSIVRQKKEEKMANTNQEENPLMRNPEYKRLANEKNKLVKQMTFMEQRLEKYAYALNDKDIQQIQQASRNAAR